MDKIYKVKPEHWDDWGVYNETDAVISYGEIKRLSIEWELPEEQLLLEVEEILPE